MLESVKESVKALNGVEFVEFAAWVNFTEKDRRAKQEAVDKAQADLIVDLREAGEITAPEVAEEGAKKDSVPMWVDPGVLHSKMYTKGQRVRTSSGRVVESVHPGLNHWDPEDSAIPAAVTESQIWRDVTAEYEDEVDSPGEAEGDAPSEAEEDVPEFKAPTGAHDAYKVGDKVRFNGKVYRSVIENNSWSPADYPQGWAEVV